MTTTLDDQTLDALLANDARGEPIDHRHLGSLIRELRTRRALEDRLRDDQAALMELARSEAIRSGDLDQALREITETAAQILDVARASVWRYDDDRSSIVCLDLYRRDEGVHESGVELSQSDFPGYFAALLSDRTISAHDAHTDPRTAEFSEVYLTPLGINSMLDAPLRVGGQMIGVTCNEHTGTQRTWSKFDELCASALADFAALAINSQQRHRTETELRATIEVAEQRLHTIERQRLAIADLSVPLIDVWQGILALPVIGLVDTERSLHMTERLLERIHVSGARAVIIDLTGVDTVDTMTANNLLQMLRSAQLLGAFCVLSGISPDIAQTLVQLHIDMAEVATVRNLEQALKLCLRQRQTGLERHTTGDLEHRTRRLSS